MACCKCCCGNRDCSNGDLGKCCCGGDCCEANEYCCNGQCTDTPPCGLTGSGSFTLATCEQKTREVFVQNTCCCTATLALSGSCDDDVIIDGFVLEDGQHPFWNPPICGHGGVNGAHNWSYSKTLAPNEGVWIGGRDNGGGGSVSWSWSLTCNPLP